MVVVLDELADSLFELSWQIVVFQQDPVFHRAMIPRRYKWPPARGNGFEAAHEILLERSVNPNP
jgi:hypothetical protein